MVKDTRPYAQALYEIAQETGKEEECLATMKMLSSIWQDNPDWVKTLNHPKITRQKKEEMIRSLFEEKLNSTLMRFLLVLNAHDAAGALMNVYSDLVSFHQKAKNIEVVKVQSAVSLDKKQIEDLTTMLKNKLQKDIELDIQVEPSLIAGLRVQTQEYVFDNSVLSRLQVMKDTLKGSR